MKQLTCAALGGPCDTAITANDQMDMEFKVMEHMGYAHPELAAKMAQQSDEEKNKWREDFNKKWEEAPDS